MSKRAPASLLLFSQLEMPTFSLLGCGGQLPVGKQGERSDVPRGGWHPGGFPAPAPGLGWPVT